MERIKNGTAKYHGTRFDLYSYKNDEKNYVIIAKHHEFLGISGMVSREFQFYNNNIEFPQIEDIDNIQMMYYDAYKSGMQKYQTVSDIIYDSDKVEKIKDLVKSNGIIIDTENVFNDNYYFILRSSSVGDNYGITRTILKLNNKDDKYYIQTINGEDEYAEMPTELFLQLTGNADNSAGTDG